MTPDEAAKPFTKFLEGMSLDQSGKLWAPSECPSLAYSLTLC